MKIEKTSCPYYWVEETKEGLYIHTKSAEPIETVVAEDTNHSAAVPVVDWATQSHSIRLPVADSCGGDLSRRFPASELASKDITAVDQFGRRTAEFIPSFAEVTVLLDDLLIEAYGTKGFERTVANWEDKATYPDNESVSIKVGEVVLQSIGRGGTGVGGPPSPRTPRQRSANPHTEEQKFVSYSSQDRRLVITGA